MQILVSSNERIEVRQALGELGLEASLPFDFLMYSMRGSIAAERKQFPGDFVASVRDGRLAKECAAMRQETPWRVVIVEGEPRYSAGGKLILQGKPSEWTRKGIRNLFRSIRYVEGCDVEFSMDIQDTVEVLKEVQSYFDQKDHLSLRRRPSFESSWPVPIYEERFVHWLQGCGPQFSIIRARAIAQIFKSPLEIASAYMDGTLTERLKSIHGISDKLAGAFVGFWEGTA